MTERYSQYLKTIDMKFSSSGGGPFPEPCYFTIGGRNTIEGVDSYYYVNLKHGLNSGIHCYQGSPYFRDNWSHHFFMLTDEEYINIFYDYYGSSYEGPPNYKMRIPWELVQFEAVKKIHNDMVAKEGDPSAAYSGYHIDPYFYDPFNPSEHGGAMFPYGTDLSYGLELELVPHAVSNYELVGDKKIDGNGYFIDDSPVENYQQGKTVFYPHLSWNTTATFNINSPAVREYWVQVLVQKGIENRDNIANFNRIFMDNLSAEYGMVNSRGVEVEYVYPRDPSETNTVQREYLVKHYARLYASIVKEVQERYYILYGEYLDFIGNGLYIDEDTQYRNHFLTELFEYAGEYINGGIIETSFNCGLIEKHISRIADFATEDKKITYLYNLGTLSLDADYNSQEVYLMFLFFCLVAQENTYFYVGPNYESSSFNSIIFDYPLGNPIDSVAYYDGTEDVWKREYEEGTIVFNAENVEGNILTSDVIWIIGASKEYIFSEETLSISEDTSSIFFSDPDDTATIVVDGVNFVIKNEDGLLVWDNDSETNRYSFTSIGQTIYREAGSSYFKVIYDGEGSILFTIEFAELFALTYKIIADLIDDAQSRGDDIVGYLSNMTDTLSNSEIIAGSVDRQRLEDQINATSDIMTNRHQAYTSYVLDFVRILQKYIDDHYSSVNDFLSDNGIQVKSVFADISETVGYPIDAANIENVS